MTLRRRSPWPARPSSRGLRSRTEWRWARPEAATAALVTGATWTVIMLVRLFAGGAVGTADQGDSRRLMCQLGVRALKPFGADASKYVYTAWISHQWYGEACGADGSGEAYHSSQLLLLRLAKPVTRALNLPGTLDLRAVGIICAAAVGLALTALVLFLPGSTRRRVTIASLVGLAVADGSVAEYFVSPYSEPAALVGIVGLTAALLWLWRAGESTWPRLIVVAGTATFAMLAKPQLVALLPAVILALVWLPHRPADGGDSNEAREPPPGVIGRVGAWTGGRWPALVACAMVTTAVVVYLDSSPRRFTEISVVNQVFLEILPHSDDRTGDLRSLGADPTLAPASGTDASASASALRMPAYRQFRTDVTQASILRFYAAHPDRLPRLAWEGLGGMGVWRQNYLGTYTPDSGEQPGAQECRVCVYAEVFASARDLPVLILALWAATLAAGIAVLRDRRLGPPERGVGRLAIFLVLAANLEFWATMLTEGISDLYKHLIVTNLLTALCVPILLACLLVRRVGRRSRLVPEVQV